MAFSDFKSINMVIKKYPRRCCINQKDSLIINYLQFEPILVKLLLINNLAVFMQQRQYPIKIQTGKFFI